MKEITLTFREVAVDGLPEYSMDCAVIHQYGRKHPNKLEFSSVHKLFNCADYYSTEKAKERAIDNITYWMPLDEFNAAFKEDAQDVQTLD